MITNYLKEIGTKRKQSQSDKSDESNPKKNKKWNVLVGFDNKRETLKKIEDMKKNPPAGNWRKFTKIKVNYTYLEKDWSYAYRNFRETFLIPPGMLKTLERLYSNKKTYHSCSVLPESVKQELGLSEEEYKKEKMKLTVSHKGNKGLKTFDYICCFICQKDKIPVVLETYNDKLPEHAKVNYLIDQWDILGTCQSKWFNWSMGYS